MKPKRSKASKAYASSSFIMGQKRVATSNKYRLENGVVTNLKPKLVLTSVDQDKIKAAQEKRLKRQLAKQ